MTIVNEHDNVESKMRWAKRILGSILLTVILLAAFAWRGNRVAANTPIRETIIQVKYTEYQWWLISWYDNQVLCQLSIDHDDLPTSQEVLDACGEELLDTWLTTPPCQIILDEDSSVSNCEGLYMHKVSFEEKQKDVVVELPLPTVWINVDGCSPLPPENRCPNLPNLLLSAEEPLPNEHIIGIHGFYDGNPFNCDSANCLIPLQATPVEGAVVEFWADSSYGDSTEHYTARVRVIDTGVSSAPGGTGWYVDVISSQWKGAPIASCAANWEAFPPIGQPPIWLSTPDSSLLIASDEPYYYLAGRLISQGLVNADDCPGGGLLSNGYADACGLERARSMVETWQNQFDARIIQAAQETGVPAQLLKNLFAQESQFWPGIFRVPYEFGLGQLTDNGADSILLWDASFFSQFCPLVLLKEHCDEGYLSLQEEDKAILRGALALEAKSDCEDCVAGIDLSISEFSIDLFANTLEANCEQVGQSIHTATGQVAGAVASYEDLWKLTIANYHAGPGCVSYAIYSSWQNTGVLIWDEVRNWFTDPCKGVIPYVEKIAQ